MTTHVELAAALTAKRTTRSASKNDPEPVETPSAPPPPPRLATEMSHAELAKADHSTPSLLDALDAALGSLGVAKPNRRRVKNYQDKLKAVLHAKTQEGKTIKTNVGGSIIWDAPADAALREGVPEGFVYTNFSSRDGPAVWRDIAGRLNLDAKHAGALSKRYSDLTAAERNPGGFDNTAHLAAAQAKKSGLQPGQVRKRTNPYYADPTEPELEYAMEQTLEKLKALVPVGVDLRTACECERVATCASMAVVEADPNELVAWLSLNVEKNHCHPRCFGGDALVDAAVLSALLKHGETILGNGGLSMTIGRESDQRFYRLQRQTDAPLVLLGAASDRSRAAEEALKSIELSGVEVDLVSVGGAQGSVQLIAMPEKRYRAAVDDAAAFRKLLMGAVGPASLALAEARGDVPPAETGCVAVALSVSEGFVSPRDTARAAIAFASRVSDAASVLAGGSCSDVAVGTVDSTSFGWLSCSLAFARMQHVADSLEPISEPAIYSIRCENFETWAGNPLDPRQVDDMATLQGNVRDTCRRLLTLNDPLNLTPTKPGARCLTAILTNAGVYAWMLRHAVAKEKPYWYTPRLLPCTSNTPRYRYTDYLVSFYASMRVITAGLGDDDEVCCVAGDLGKERYRLACTAVLRGESPPDYASKAFDAVPSGTVRDLHRLPHSSAARWSLVGADGLYEKHAPLGELRKHIIRELLVNSQTDRAEIFRVAKVLKPELALPPAATCAEILRGGESFADADEYADDDEA